MTGNTIEVHREGTYQFLCSVFDAPPQIQLKMEPFLTAGSHSSDDLYTCKANSSIITYLQTSTRITSLNCSTHTDLNGPAFSSTTISITEGQYQNI